MLCMNSYPKAYIENSQHRLDRQIADYRKLRLPRTEATAAFEKQFLRHMLLALEHYFCHRSRTREKKDGNPLNELRMLCTSIMESDGRLASDSTIQYDVGLAVLQLDIGDRIDLDVEDFQALSRAVFADLQRKFMRP